MSARPSPPPHSIVLRRTHPRCGGASVDGRVRLEGAGSWCAPPIDGCLDHVDGVLQQALPPITNGGRKRSTLPKVPAVSTTTPSAWQAFAIRPVRLGVRLECSRAHQLDGDHGATSPNVTDRRDADPASARSRATMIDSIRRAAAVEIQFPHGGDRSQRSGARHRISAVGTAEPAGMHRVHQVGPSGHGRQGQPAGHPLGHDHEVRDDLFVLGGEPGAGPAEAAPTLSATKITPCSAHHRLQRRRGTLPPAP